MANNTALRILRKLSKSQKDALAYFKKREGLFQHIPLLDSMVRGVVAAWDKMPVKMEFDASKAPTDPHKKWAWLWSKCIYDPLEMSYLTGYRDQVFFPLAQAKGHRLIYPDGSISRVAEIKILFPFMTDQDKIKYGLAV